jgi:hypothetical protein
MPNDPTPTTSTPGAGKKKTTLYILIGVGALGVFFLYRSKKKSEETGKEQNPYTAQSFIPVTAENVGGVGAQGGGGVSSGSGNSGNEATNQALITALQEQNKSVIEYLKSVRESQSNQPPPTQAPPITIITGGGPPAEGQPGTGGGSAGPPSGGTPGGQPETPKSIGGCPPGWKYNPGNGRPSPHSCYRESREKCHGGRCHIHGYQDGHEVCPC